MINQYAQMSEINDYLKSRGFNLQQKGDWIEKTLRFRRRLGDLSETEVALLYEVMLKERDDPQQVMAL